MPEKTNFALFFDATAGLPDREACIETLFSVASHWLGEPETFMLLNWQLGSQIEGDWLSRADTIPPKLSENEGLTIYPIRSSKHKGNSLSVQEGNGCAIYTIAINEFQLLESSMLEVEDWIMSLSKSVSRFRPLIAAGSETELDTDLKTAAEALKSALGRELNCYWVVTSIVDDLNQQTQFQVAKQMDNAVLLRRRELLETLNFRDSL